MCHHNFLAICKFVPLFGNIQLEEKSCKRRGLNDGPVVEKLLKLMLIKTNKHFKGLCQSLAETGQEFLVKSCLSQKGEVIISVYSPV